jgi:hypothetical protein
MDGTIGAAAPVGVNLQGAVNTAGIASGSGFGGDNGTGFHSSRPIGLPVDTANQHTENAHTKTRLDENKANSDVSPSIPSFQKWSESPFTTYVSRNTSSGKLPSGIPSFKPVDRSNMGIPLNPFWIRNDTWGMQHEADIFTDTGGYFTAAKVMSSGAQSSQNLHRTIYLDNLEQPQEGSGPTGLGSGSDDVPMESGAGSVTGVAEPAPEGEMAIDSANPAKTEAPEGSPDSKLEGGDTGKEPPAKDSKDLAGGNDKPENTSSQPPKKKAKVSRIKPQTGTGKKDPKKVKTNAE